MTSSAAWSEEQPQPAHGFEGDEGSETMSRMDEMDEIRDAVAGDVREVPDDEAGEPSVPRQDLTQQGDTMTDNVTPVAQEQPQPAHGFEGDEGSETMSRMHTTAKNEVKRLNSELEERLKERTRLNSEIKVLRQDLAGMERVLRSFEGRKKK